jgi:hypothetical protein
MMAPSVAPFLPWPELYPDVEQCFAYDGVCVSVSFAKLVQRPALCVEL